MAASIWERVESREIKVGPLAAGDFGPTEVVLRYGMAGVPDENTARELVQSTISAYFGVLLFQDYRLSPKGNGVWDVEVQYGQREVKKPGDIVFAFDTGAERTKITNSLATVDSFVPTGDDVIDFKGAINVKEQSGKLQVEGLDITLPQATFTVTRYIAPVNMTSDYVNLLFDAAWCVNSDTVELNALGTIISFMPGELLFEQASGQQRGTEDVEITLKLHRSANQTDIAIGDITVTEKLGWHYMWVYYEEEEDPTSHVLTKVPRQVNIEQVYEETPLSPLFA